jgi:pyruvate dehydrogenase E2 component (dihydrolipoamide acetyltransferase)
MAQLVTMPQLGSTMEEGRVVLWTRQEGEAIRQGETLLEVETDKTIVEVPAPGDGVVLKILAPAETRVPIHHLLAILGLEREDITSLLPTDRSADRSDISPRARRIADEAGVPLTALVGHGSGPGGRLIERDVLAYLERQRGASPQHPPPDIPQVIAPTTFATPCAAQQDKVPTIDLNDLALGLPGSQVRPMEAAHTPLPLQPAAAAIPAVGSTPALSQSALSPTVTLRQEVDMTACVALRDQLIPAVAQAYGVTLGCIEMVVKAIAQALERTPLSGSLHPSGGTDSPGDVSISVTRFRNADELPMPQDFALLTQTIQRAGSKTLGVLTAELSASPIETRSAIGEAPAAVFPIFALLDEIDRCDPVLAPMQVAALGLGRIAERPVVRAGQIVPRQTMEVCLACDAHVVDLATAARLLSRIRERIESPLTILV